MGKFCTGDIVTTKFGGPSMQVIGMDELNIKVEYWDGKQFKTVCFTEAQLIPFEVKANQPDWQAIRIQFAGMAMQGHLANTDYVFDDPVFSAQFAVKQADALIAELQKPYTKPE